MREEVIFTISSCISCGANRQMRLCPTTVTPATFRPSAKIPLASMRWPVGNLTLFYRRGFERPLLARAAQCGCVPWLTFWEETDADQL